MLTIILSNPEEQSIFSRVHETLASQRVSLQMVGTLSSFVTFQRNRQEKQTCYQYNTPKNIIEKVEKVRREHNKKHHSLREIFNRLFIEMQYMLYAFICEIHFFVCNKPFIM